MFCSKCGSKVEDGLNFCPNCGAPVSNQNNTVIDTNKSQKVTFAEAMKLYFSNLFNFSGKATKSEFWWSFLFNSILFILFELIDLIISRYLFHKPIAMIDLINSRYPNYLFFPLGIGGFLQVLLVLMGTSIAVRRMHDIGKPGTLVLIYLIPLIIYASSMIPLDTFKDPKIIYGGSFLFLVGGIVFLIFAAKPSKS